jgi:hypothetical protein
MLPLSRSNPLLPEFPPFILDMLEVVDSPVKSSKYVHTYNEQESKAHTQNRVNQTVQFSELDDLVSSAPTIVRSTVGSNESVILPVK